MEGLEMKTKYAYVKWFLLCSLFLVMVCCFSGIAQATNGYFSNGYSLESKALAGAGVALPQGSLDASINPAEMAFVGTRIDVGLSLFNPNREYTVKGAPSGYPGTFGLAPGTVKSDSRWFLIPSIGASKELDDSNSIGISIYVIYCADICQEDRPEACGRHIPDLCIPEIRSKGASAIWKHGLFEIP